MTQNIHSICFVEACPLAHCAAQSLHAAGFRIEALGETILAQPNACLLLDDALEADPAQAILEQAAQNGIRTIALSDATAAGPTTEAPLSEKQLPPAPPGSARACFEAALQSGQPITLLDIPLLFGPHLPPDNPLNQWIAKALQGKRPRLPGPANTRVTVAYSRDLFNGLQKCLQQETTGQRFILGGETSTLHVWVSLLAEWLGQKPPREPTGAWYSNLLAALQRLAPADPHTQSLAPFCQDHYAFSSQKAISQLGYTRTPLKIALLQTLEHHGFSLPEESVNIL